jgi:YidC/Oxa1 family membrane protein insertase
MFNDLIVQPIFNLLALVYALLPGHNFGLALILFTIIVRLLLWPLVKRQLHHAKSMRKLQPELKRIKKDAKGNRQKESALMMELYKERGINPFGTIPILIVQFIVLIGLYYGLLKIIQNPKNIIDFAYPFIQNLSWMQTLAQDIRKFDETLFGIVDLSRAAIGKEGFYLPAFLLVIASGAAQYFQSKMLLPQDKDQRSLRTILREAGQGKQADQAEVNAAVGKSTIFFLPVIIILFTINLASALSLYWLVGGLVAIIQQNRVLNQDEEEMEALADEKKPRKDVKSIPEAEIVATKPTKKSSSKNKKSNKNKRRKR